MKKIVSIVMMLVMCLSIVTGCKSNKYNAVMYSSVQDWISDEFLKENRVKGYYKNEDFVEGKSDWSDSYIYDEDSPESRTFTITEEDKFNEIVTKHTLDVDFKNQMAILFIFSDKSPREYHLKKVEVKEQTLDIYFKLESKKWIKDATAPYQRCMLVILDKLEINTVNFNEHS